MQSKALVAALCFCAALQASARTWRVEKDGTGDYTVIQDALDVAAAGDTIRIGRGRFEDFEIHTPYLHGTVPIIMFVQRGPLTILGSGSDQTFVGPAVATFQFEGLPTRGIMQERPGARVHWEGFTVENVNRSMYLAEGGVLRDCRFRFGFDFLMTFEPEPIEDLLIEDCVFEGVRWEDGLSGIASIIGSSQPRMQMRNTMFRNLWAGMDVEYCTDCVFESVRFDACRDGMTVRHTTLATLSQIEFARMNRVDLHITNSNLVIEQSTFGPSQANVAMNSGECTVTGSGNRLGGGSVGTVGICSACSFEIHDSDILNGGGPTILNRTYASYHPVMNLENNYWGTTDSTQIAAWIVDDVPNGVTAAQIDFSPFRERSVPVTKSSLGALKARFRN